MKRKSVLSFIAAFTAIILIAVPVLAATIGTISAFNSSTTSYTNLGFRLGVNNNELVTAGTISADGLNTAVQEAGVNIPTMIATNATYFVANLTTAMGKSWSMVNGLSLPNHKIITGNNSYITITDSASVRLDGSNFTIAAYLYFKQGNGPIAYVNNYITINGTSNGSICVTANYTGVIRSFNTTAVSEGERYIRVTSNSTSLSCYVDNVINGNTSGGAITYWTSNNTWYILSNNISAYCSSFNVSPNGTQTVWYSPNSIISGNTLPDRSNNDDPGTIVWGNFPITPSVTFVPTTNLALAPAYTIGAGPGFLGSNLTMSGNFTANTTHQTGGVPGATFIEDVAQAGGSPPILLYGVIASMFIILFGLFLSWMERKFGSTAEISLIRIALGASIIGVMIAFGKFDWWMLFFYLVITFSIYLFRPPEGSVEQLNLIGFLATSWVGLTLINRMMAAQFITSTETVFLNNFTFTRSYNIQNIVSIPILNLDFVNGLAHLFKWDYSFFGGNAQIIQYFLYSFTLVGSFVIFGMLIYAISGLFLRR